MGSYNSAILPSTTGLDLGSPLQEWDLFAQDVTASGNVAATGNVTAGGDCTVDGSVTTGAGGTAISQIKVYTAALTPSSVNSATVAEQTYTVTGLTTADKVIVNPPSISNATGIVGARVSAKDTLALRWVNPTAGALTPTSGNYIVISIRS